MKEIDLLNKWFLGCKASYDRRKKNLEEGIEKTKTKRQERTGKPYRQN